MATPVTEKHYTANPTKKNALDAYEAAMLEMEKTRERSCSVDRALCGKHKVKPKGK